MSMQNFKLDDVKEVVIGAGNPCIVAGNFSGNIHVGAVELGKMS